MSDSSPREKWIEITLTTPAELTEALSNYLIELETQGLYQEELVEDSFDDIPESDLKDDLKAYLPYDQEAKKKIRALKEYIRNLSRMFPELDRPTLQSTTITNPDWSEQWKKYFKPIRISRDIIVKPTWERYESRGRDIVIDIDPGMAFGTGQHPSTWMCIVALEEIIRQNRETATWNALDVGTGTGILAICGAKLGIRHITAVDLDPKAVEIAEKNIALNAVADRIEITNADVATLGNSFDLIIANITANDLIRLQPHLTALMEEGGYLILSGIIDKDAQRVENVYRAGNISLHTAKTEKEWVCFTFRK